jgi:glycosyltransferase involved in cell wall biosynthesis
MPQKKGKGFPLGGRKTVQIVAAEAANVRLSGKILPSSGIPQAGTLLAQLARVKILWVKKGKLLPVDTGGKIRSFNLLRGLAARNDVTLLSYYGGPRDLDYERAIVEEFPRAVAIHANIPDDAMTGTWPLEYVRRVLSPAPYAVTKHTTERVRQLVTTWDRERRFDVLLCDFLAASLNFPRRCHTPSVLFQHNVESILWRRWADTERRPAHRAVFQLEAWKMERYERATVARFDHVIAVSEADREAMARMIPAERITVVPTGVDTKAFKPAVRNTAPDPIVLFLGSMDWEPNIDGVQYFVEDMWPAIRAAVPGARFQVVGRNPAPSVKGLSANDIEIVGTVPSVIDYLHRAAAVVVPLRVGGGTRLKIYEAMGAGKAVISTSIGAEGLDYNDGRDILIADTPDAFARRVIDVLRDHERRRSLEDAALALASRYDWSSIARTFEATLDRALAARAPELRFERPVDVLSRS